jgi:hypothetical protein
VRVGQEYGSCVALQSLLHHFTRMYAGTVDGSTEQLNEFDEAMPGIEE